MNIKAIFLASLCGALIALLVVRFLPTSSLSTRSAPQSAFERVMQTGTLRCGWFLTPSFFERDINTGAFSGIYYDLMEEMGRQLNLKIEWAEEVSSASVFEGLRTQRFDVSCAPHTPTPARARVAAFTIPTAYRPTYVYVREDDTRFDNAYEKINNPSVKISVIEGQGAQAVAEKMFPKANLLTLPSFTDLTQNEMNIATKKADVSINEPGITEKFIQNNPGKIRRAAGPPLIVRPATLQVGLGEEKLKDMLNTSMDLLLDTGVIARIYKKHLGEAGDAYFLPAQKWSQP